MADIAQETTAQDFTAGPIRLNLNMVYDPATAMARGEPLFLGRIEPKPTIRDLKSQLSEIEDLTNELVNLKDAVECVIYEALSLPLTPGSQEAKRRSALIGVTDALFAKIDQMKEAVY